MGIGVTRDIVKELNLTEEQAAKLPTEKTVNLFDRLFNSTEGAIAQQLDSKDGIFDGYITAENWNEYAGNYGQHRTDKVLTCDVLDEIVQIMKAKLKDTMPRRTTQDPADDTADTTPPDDGTANPYGENPPLKLPKKRPPMGLDTPPDEPAAADTDNTQTSTGLPKKVVKPNETITNPDGTKTEIKYDDPYYQKIETCYNAFGHKQSIKYYRYGSIAREESWEGPIRVVKDFDPLGRVSHEEHYSSNGNVFTSIDYEYDSNGNETRIETSYDDNGNVAATHRVYNGRPADIDGKIDNFEQGNVGDCWLCAGLKALSDKSWGKQYIKNAIEIQPNGDVVVTLRGAKSKQKKFTVTAEELSRQTNYSSGDRDVLAIELAVEKYRAQYRETLTGGMAEEIFRLITGSYNTKTGSYQDNSDKPLLERYAQNPDKYAGVVSIDTNNDGFSDHACAITRVEKLSGNNYKIYYWNPHGSESTVNTNDKNYDHIQILERP